MPATDTPLRMITERFAATLFDASPDGMLVVDASGAIRLANRAADTLFGTETGELVGTNVDALVPSEQRQTHESLRSTYRADPTTRPMGTGPQLLAEHTSGTLFPVEISLSPVELDGSTYTIATVRDVTQRQHDAAQIELLRDRERIARDLHDMVIQRLFGSGLGLQAVLGSAEPAFVRERISEVIDELDATIREIRDAIFGLSERATDQVLSDRIIELILERAKVMGLEPTLRLDDAVDETPDSVGDQLLATLGEALSNVARHAKATSCAITVTSDDIGITLTVRDDGIGIPTAVEHRGGLVNMAARARVLGGEFSAEPDTDGGTVIVWSVPV